MDLCYGTYSAKKQRDWKKPGTSPKGLMLGLHRETHRYFLEPVSGTKHIISIYRRFLTFVGNVLKSKKRPLRKLCSSVLSDCRSTTGRNLRKLMLRFDAGIFEELKGNVQKKSIYKEANVHDLWKIESIKDLVEAKFDRSILPNFTSNEIDDLRDHISTC